MSPTNAHCRCHDPPLQAAPIGQRFGQLAAHKDLCGLGEGKQKRRSLSEPPFIVTAQELPRKLLMLQALRLQRICAQSAFLIFFVVFKVAFKPLDMRVAFKGQHMGANPVKEEAIV